jgi:GTP pyrophosphokinase
MVAASNLSLQSLADPDSRTAQLALLGEGLPAEASLLLTRALDSAVARYGEETLATGESVLKHGLAMATIAASLNLDLDTRLAAILFDLPHHLDEAGEHIATEFGPAVALLVDGLSRLYRLRLITRQKAKAGAAGAAGSDAKAQAETLRKMLLAMVEDIRVVLLRLISRIQTLRYFVDHFGPSREQIARESLESSGCVAIEMGA